MMNSFNGAFAGWHLHIIFFVMLLIGIILFLVWAVRNLNKKQLANWAAVLIVLGILGMLLTSGFGYNSWSNMMGKW